jgi:hypothetical protein
MDRSNATWLLDAVAQFLRLLAWMIERVVAALIA